MTTKAFHLGDVLSVTTGILMSPSKPPIDGVYKILNYLTGDNLMTHQLPRAVRQVRPTVIAQHPWLADISLDSMPHTEVAATLARLVAEHGETVELVPMTNYEGMDPLGELMSMTDKPIVVVKGER